MKRGISVYAVLVGAAGERVVVTANEQKGRDGKTTMIATEIRLPEAVASK